MNTTAGDDSLLGHAREMALNRLAFGALIGVYFTAVGSARGLQTAVVAYFAFACAVFAWLRWRPSTSG